MKCSTRPVDPQLQLATLFMALAESPRREKTQGHDDQPMPQEVLKEDPDRWDAMFTG